MDKKEIEKILKNSSLKRYKTPTVIQMEAVECGAASLSMILGYYKRFVPLEELRNACGVSSDGSKASNVLKAARSYGLEAVGVKKSIEELAEMKSPVIIFWAFNHFLVVEGFSKKGVHLNDPASGPRLVTYEEFSKKYTGLALLFRPSPTFEKKGAPPSVIDALKKRMHGLKKPFLYLSIVQLSAVVPVLAMAAFTRIFIDKIILGGNLSWKWGLILAMGITIILQSFFTWAKGKSLFRLNGFLSMRLSSFFFHHIMRLPSFFYEQRSAGELAMRMQLNDTVVNAITGQIARSAMNLLLLVFYFFVMLIYSVPIAFVVLVGGLMQVALLIWINRTRTDAMSKLVQDYYQMVSFSVGGLQSMQTIKSLGLESDFFSKWAGFNAKWINANQGFGKQNAILNTLSPLVKNLTNAAIILLGGYLVIVGDISVGLIMGLQVIAKYFQNPLMDLVGLGKGLQTLKANLMRLDDSMNNPLDKNFSYEIPAGIKKNHILEGHISLQNVTFGYNQAADAFIEDLNIDIPKGKTIALVGSTGSGKSTIGKMIAGLYHPWEGKILFDGKTRYEYAPETFTNSLSKVDQDIALFSGTIRENICMWNSSISEEAVQKAAKDACIHEQIMLRKEGYNHVLEEGGSDLSGGERQRIEIARALVTDPVILILDEATSALDAQTEETIVNNIRHRGCTCIMVAHRLSTIRDADHILVLRAGEVVQQGTHESLMQEGGFYKELIAHEGVMSHA